MQNCFAVTYFLIAWGCRWSGDAGILPHLVEQKRPYLPPQKQQSFAQSKLLSAKEIAKELITTIHAYGRPGKTKDEIIPMFQRDDELCILVNNLGGTSNFEMSIFGT